MRATVGDRVVIPPTHVDEASREGEVLEVHGSGGEPPWLVRWASDGHESLFFPGPDAHVDSGAGGQGGG